MPQSPMTARRVRRLSARVPRPQKTLLDNLAAALAAKPGRVRVQFARGAKGRAALDLEMSADPLRALVG